MIIVQKNVGGSGIEPAIETGGGGGGFLDGLLPICDVAVASDQLFALIRASPRMGDIHRSRSPTVATFKGRHNAGKMQSGKSFIELKLIINYRRPLVSRNCP